MIDLHFTSAYVAAALATAALICDQAIGLEQERAVMPAIAGAEHPGQPERPERVRLPADRSHRQQERPMARLERAAPLPARSTRS